MSQASTLARANAAGSDRLVWRSMLGRQRRHRRAHVDAPDGLAVHRFCQRGHAHAALGLAASVADHDALARMRLHARLQLEEIMHRLAVDGNDLIAGGKAGARGRAIGFHRAEHRRNRRLVEAQAQAVASAPRLGEPPALGRRSGCRAARCARLPSAARTASVIGALLLTASSRSSSTSRWAFTGARIDRDDLIARPQVRPARRC